MKNIIITDDAKKYMLDKCVEKDVDGIRYSLKSGGCAGYIANWEFVENDEDSDDDFSYPITCVGSADLRDLIIDKYTMEQLVDGTIIDYNTRNFMPSIKVTVPNTIACGCGESFTKTGE